MNQIQSMEVASIDQYNNSINSSTTMNQIYSMEVASIDNQYNNNICRSRSITPPRLHLTAPYSMDTSPLHDDRQPKPQQHQHQQSLLRAMQQQHEKDKQKQEYLRKLHYIKMATQEQVYRSQLQLLRSISSDSCSNDCYHMGHTSLTRLQQEPNDDNDDDDSLCGGCNDNGRCLDLLEDTDIDPIIQRHMSIPSSSSSSHHYIHTIQQS